MTNQPIRRKVFRGWLHQTATKLSYFACTQRHSKAKRALLFQLLNSHTKPVKGNSFSLPLRRKQNRTRRGLHAAGIARDVTHLLRQHPLTPCKNFIPGLSPWQQELPGEANPGQTVKVTAALVGSLTETSQPVGRQGLILHSVPQAFVLTRRELHNNKLSGTVDQQGAFFPPPPLPHTDALHPSTCSIFELPRPRFK